MKLSLPAILRVEDYHEFDTFQDNLRQIGVKGVKVYEAGFDGPHCGYVGMVYVGDRRKALKHPNVAPVLKAIRNGTFE